jgi:hypothetical protein
MRPLIASAGAATPKRAITGAVAAAAAGVAGATQTRGAATTSVPRSPAQPGSGAGGDPAVRGLRPCETASWEVASSEDVERLRRALRDLVSLSLRSLRDVERELAAHGRGFDVSRLLSGRFGLKVHQLLDLCRAIGVHPMELFRLAFEEPRTPSPIVERMAALVGPGTAQSRLRAPGSAEQLSQLEAVAGRVETLQGQVDELLRRTADVGALAPGAPSGRRL